MRYHTILLEYDRKITFDKFADLLIHRIKRDTSANFWHHFLSVKKEAGESLADYVTRRSVDHFLMMCEQADPTPQNKYVPWIVRTYLKNGIARFEDIGSTCADYLEQFEDIKNSGYFKRPTTSPAMKEVADINRIRSLFELRSVLNAVSPAERISNNEKTRSEDRAFRENGEVEFIVDTAVVALLVPKTEAAAKFYGRNTQWCTSANRQNMFSVYNRKGPLFIILAKANNRRWQLHFGDMQFMDENDQPISSGDWEDIPDSLFQHREAILAFYEQMKNLTGAKLLTFRAFGYEELGAIARRIILARANETFE